MIVFIMGGTTEGKAIGKYEDLFLSLSTPSMNFQHRQALFFFTMVKIVIVTVELSIECLIVFVAF